MTVKVTRFLGCDQTNNATDGSDDRGSDLISAQNILAENAENQTWDWCKTSTYNCKVFTASRKSMQKYRGSASALKAA